MKRGIQGVTRREQPKLPITISVAYYTLFESLLDSQKYNLYFREISWGLIGTDKGGRFIFSVVIAKRPVVGRHLPFPITRTLAAGGNAKRVLPAYCVEKLEHTEISYQPRAREFDALLFAERKLNLHHSPLRNYTFTRSRFARTDFVNTIGRIEKYSEPLAC